VNFVMAWLGLAALAAGQPQRYAVYRSDDQGHSWLAAHRGPPPGARVNALGAVGSAILAGTDAGLFVSPDMGRQWSPAGGDAAAARRILSLATLDGLAFAGTQRDGLLVSSDGGRHWGRAPGAGFQNIRALLAHEGQLYAGTDAAGVFVSADAGRSWRRIALGLPAGAQVFALAGTPGRVLAGLYSKGLYALDLPGLTWRKVGPVEPLALAAGGGVLLAGHNPGGVYGSVDAGATWARAMLPGDADSGRAAVWELAAGQGLAIAGVEARIYVSRDAGRSWTHAMEGLPPRAAGIAFLIRPGVTLAALSLPGD
jgi:photosystem II stability/assembly factor-like uncharacterized protein